MSLPVRFFLLCCCCLILLGCEPSSGSSSDDTPAQESISEKLEAPAVTSVKLTEPEALRPVQPRSAPRHLDYALAPVGSLTDLSGRSMQARIIAANDQQVRVQRGYRDFVTVDIDTLSLADQTNIRSMERLPRMDTAGQVLFSVYDFGAVGDGEADDGPAIRAAVTAAIESGPGSVVAFDDYDYRMQRYSEGGAHIALEAVSDLTLEGNGATIIGTPYNGFLSINESEGITVRGFVFDCDRLNFMQGDDISPNITLLESFNVFLENFTIYSEDVGANDLFADNRGIIVVDGDPTGALPVEAKNIDSGGAVVGSAQSGAERPAPKHLNYRPAPVGSLTDVKGRSMQARIIAAGDTKVRVQREDGDLFTLELNTLSSGDQARIRGMQELPRMDAAGRALFPVYDFGAMGDGETDDGPAIRAAVAAAIQSGPESVIVFDDLDYRFLPYQGDAQVMLESVSSLTFEGNGATIIGTPGTGFLSVSHSSGITVRGFVFDCEMTSESESPNFTIRESSNISLENYTVYPGASDRNHAFVGNGGGILVDGDLAIAPSMGAGIVEQPDSHPLVTNTEVPASLTRLDVFTRGFPKAIYFRGSEGKAARPYSWFVDRFGRLDGMIGKMLDEEIYGRTTNSLPRYLEYKAEFPDQLVLLHCNGNARDPRFDREAFAPQFFVHYVGCKALESISSTETVSVIKVEDTSLFRTNIGRDEAGTDNITICALDDRGKPDWTVHEETILLSIDEGNSTITVERGAFGTKPLKFRANEAYLAAHDYEGPWGVGGKQIMWSYNYALKHEPDSNGKRLWEVLAEDLGNRFLPGGQLELLDGIEFDVLSDRRGTNSADGRSKDFDGDGKRDGVDKNRINTYGVGVIKFLTRLREIMGPGKLIMADGHSSKKQRGFNILNGIESERFPDFYDKEIDEWSGGINRHLFWLENAYQPAFSFIKYDQQVDPKDFAPNFHRLGYAAAVFTDAAISPAERKRNGFEWNEWDEIRAGELNRWNWLGRPLGPMQHLAQQQPNLLSKVELASLITTSAEKVDSAAGLELTGERGDIEFTLEVPGHRLDDDLTVCITLSADPIPGYPVNRNRLFKLKGTSEKKSIMSWAGTKPFDAVFYFKDLSANQLSATFESSERVTLHSVTAHALPDICYRVFENGVVIANPSLDPFEFDAARLLPGMNLQHLKAHRNQDDAVNTGLPAGDLIHLPAKDAIFLIRQEAIE